jgi:hypothetical protein
MIQEVSGKVTDLNQIISIIALGFIGLNTPIKSRDCHIG